MSQTTERAVEIHRTMTPHQMALALEKAERALTAAGFTLASPANEWKPPVGPSASPLLDTIDQLQAEIDNLALPWDYIERLVKVLSWLGYSTPESKEEQAAKQNRLVFNLIRAVEESKDLLTKAATEQDYRELQSQHDELQSLMLNVKRERDELEKQLHAAKAEARKYKLNGLGLAAALGERVEVPEGWQLVPVEPTEAMLEEIRLTDCFQNKALSARYSAMLAAAPKPEGGAAAWIDCKVRLPAATDADSNGDVLWLRSGAEMPGRVADGAPVDATHWRSTVGGAA